MMARRPFIRGGGNGRSRYARRGMLLVVVLAIVAMLGLLGASFSFRMNADLVAVDAIRNMQQARLACDSGLQRAILLLRDERTDVDAWYNNDQAFRRILVWAPDQEGGSTSLADQEKVEGRPAWRFSVVSYELDGDESKIRYGLTDEASKINLNTASRAQLLALFDQLELGMLENEATPEELADALIDWRDENDDKISLNGAESSYYFTLEPPYRAKNRELQSIEELLMVKGFNGRILYGEDYNRNGWLDENEDDGEDGAFPPDDQNGELDRGILPFVTIYSWDWNSANDNRSRLPLSMITSTEILEHPSFEYLVDEIDPEAIQFIVDANKRGYKFRSVGELFELEVFEDGSSNYTEAWEEYDRTVAELEQDRLDLEETEDEEATDDEAVDDQDSEGDPGGIDDGTSEDSDESASDNANEDASEDSPDKSARLNQSIRAGDEAEGDSATNRRNSGNRSLTRSSGRAQRKFGRAVTASDDAGGTEEPKAKGTPIISPVTAEQMEVICDRFSVSQDTTIAGLINVNTASPAVLKTIPGLSEEDVDSIVAERSELSGEEKATIGWLVSHGVLEAKTFALVSNMLTTRSIQFTADVIGFADHVSTFRRTQVVLEMRGHLSQILYYRDISSLGMGYPVFDDERSEGFAFTD